MRIRPDELADEYERADQEWPWIHEVNAAHGFPPFLMHALGSRETNLTNVIGDLGRGFGVWQRDIQHGIPDGWMDDVRAQCEWAADYLAGRIAACGTLLGGVNSYNAGSCETERTTGGDYGPDVLDRRAWLEENVGAPDPVDDTPPAELDPLGVNQGAHAVDVPRELAPLRFGLGPAAAAPEQLATTASVDQALAFLESQLGLAEYPPGSNINWITDWYFGWHLAWCAMTVSRALIEAGFGTPEQIDVPVETTSAKGWAYCPYVEADFRAAGRWHDGEPQPGDLVLYDWDGDGWADHVGMLKEVAVDGTLYVYEGNTDEGVLRLKHRSRTYVRGFARPPYAAPVPIPAPPEVPDVAKIAVPLEVRSGQKRRLPVVAIGGGFGWARASITFASAGVDVRRAIIGPTERPIDGLDPAGVESSRHFAGRGYVDLVAGDEWILVDLARAPVGSLDLYVEAADG